MSEVFSTGQALAIEMSPEVATAISQQAASSPLTLPSGNLESCEVTLHRLNGVYSGTVNFPTSSSADTAPRSQQPVDYTDAYSSLAWGDGQPSRVRASILLSTAGQYHLQPTCGRLPSEFKVRIVSEKLGSVSSEYSAWLGPQETMVENNRIELRFHVDGCFRREWSIGRAEVAASEERSTRDPKGLPEPAKADLIGRLEIGSAQVQQFLQRAGLPLPSRDRDTIVVYNSETASGYIDPAQDVHTERQLAHTLGSLDL